jgi:hypothetical protein
MNSGAVRIEGVTFRLTLRAGFLEETFERGRFGTFLGSTYEAARMVQIIQIQHNGLNRWEYLWCCGQEDRKTETELEIDEQSFDSAERLHPPPARRLRTVSP